jgi:hypothetical protein
MTGGESKAASSTQPAPGNVTAAREAEFPLAAVSRLQSHSLPSIQEPV